MTYGNTLLYFKLGDCSYFLNKVDISNVSKNRTSACGFLRLLVTRQDNFPGLNLPDINCVLPAVIQWWSPRLFSYDF